MFPSLALPVLITTVVPQVGLALGIAYAVLNTAGYWVFISGRRSSDRLAQWSQKAATVALPLGLFLVLLSDGSSPIDSVDPKDQAAALQVKPHLL